MRWRTECSAGKGYIQIGAISFTLNKTIAMNMALSLASLVITARRRAYSDRLRVAGTVRRYTSEINRIPARRACSSKNARIDRVGRRQCSQPIFEILS